MGEGGGWAEKMTSIHVDQIYPSETADQYSPELFQWLVIAMSIAMIITILLGIFLAFKMLRTKWTVAFVLLIGLLVPVVLLWLGQAKF